MAPRRTRSQGESSEQEKGVEPPSTNSTSKVQKKRKLPDAKVPPSNELQDALQENSILKKKLETMKAKYSDKKRIIKELNETVNTQQQKITERDNYILKLKQDREKAQHSHKSNVKNLVTTSAQNQALMTVLTAHQQSVQHMVPPHLLNLHFQPNPAFHQPLQNGLLYNPPPTFYPTVGLDGMLPRHPY